MIAFVLLLLWAPSVIGDCSTTSSCNEGNCEDQDFVWRGLIEAGGSENFCFGEGLSFSLPPTGFDCTKVPRPTIAEEAWKLTWKTFTDHSSVCTLF